ncbi:E3 ubiquitin-protein ligase DCST1-like [Ruditapes philippinarum]|uniref:E3 ubiquitin-protein ligase DCST1-like n=1 Tax=Ruditapes philippinarum TaxID=129788 RepID=UPI00295AA75B|nr:E3 ubiquitin-protein ligase DCST1-like [Ruditapes philippinarum]
MSSSGSSGSSKSSMDPEKGKPQKDSSKKKSCFLVRPLVKFFTSEPEQYHTWKMFIGFPFGAILGYGLYRLVILPMDLGEDTRQLLGAVLVFGISAGFSLSVHFRCVCLLLVPTFMGKAGRSYLGAFAMVFLIAGPVENIVDNAQDITRSLTCAAQLAANHTKAKWKFRLQPVGNVMKDMAEEGWMLNKLGKKVNKAFVPVRAEIRGDTGIKEMEFRTRKEDKLEGGKLNRAGKIDAESKNGPNDKKSKKVENKYKKKIKLECEDIYNKAMKECRKVFDRLEDRCRDKIPEPLDGVLCPLVNVGFLCKLVEPLGRALGGECKPSEIIRPSFGKMYQKSEESVQDMDQGFEVKMQYKVVKGKEDVDYTSIEEMRSNTMHDFKQGRYWLNLALVLIKRLLGFTFLLVIISAYKYRKKYTNDIRFDNIYITSYFRKIDARRMLKKKRVLLPLKKIESEQVIFPTTFKMLKSERRKLIKGSVLIFARAIFCGLVFIMCKILYNVLDIIRTNSRVDFKQSGTNTVDVKIGGTGFMSNIVRMFMSGLNTKNKLDRVSSNVECLPRPVPLDNIYYGYVFGIFFLTWMLVLLDAYCLRMRMVISAFFYRKREKQRILHLYNTMLKKRKYFLKDMRRKVKRKAKKMELYERSGLMYSLGRQFPGLCGCLAKTKAGRDKCLICEEKLKTDIEECYNEECKFVYCEECWQDVKETCYACLPLAEFSSTDSDSMSDDKDDKGDDEM